MKVSKPEVRYFKSEEAGSDMIWPQNQAVAPKRDLNAGTVSCTYFASGQASCRSAARGQPATQLCMDLAYRWVCNR
jgi:hypothetical protein